MEQYRLVPRVSEEELDARLGELADQINIDYAGKDIIVVGILKGAFVFLADLVRKLSIPVQVDFIRLASYGEKTETSGEVRITKEIELPIDGRHLLIVEDIVDSGITLDWLLKHLQGYRPESVKICALIDKTERRQVQIPLDYVGIRVPDGFLVGYGLDFSEKFRNLPGIFEVEIGE